MDELSKHFEFPFKPHDFQVAAMQTMEHRDCSLLKFKVGYGKSFASILTALKYSLNDGVEQIIILCPPILLDQWEAFLLSIKGIPSVAIYRGKPAERKMMDMDESIILASFNIFRGADYNRFMKIAYNRKLCIIADELSLKSLGSKTYRKLKMLLYRKMRLNLGDRPFHKLITLNATPISDLGQVYNWCAMFAPGVYKSKKIFELIHVLQEDPWGNVISWKDEDLMQRNMELFSVDTDKQIKMPDIVHNEVVYSLTDAHKKLYKEVKDSHLDNLPSEKIELAINSMFSALQKLILIPEDFGLNISSPILDYIDSYLGQVQGEGVLIYTRHVAVSKLLAEAIPDSAAIYGGISQKVRDKAFADLESGKVKCLVGNLDSLGIGLNLQMLNHVIFAELPFRSDKLEQSIGRIHRQGQLFNCFINIPLAKETLQERIYSKLLKNKRDINKVIKSKSDLIKFLE